MDKSIGVNRSSFAKKKTFSTSKSFLATSYSRSYFSPSRTLILLWYWVRVDFTVTVKIQVHSLKSARDLTVYVVDTAWISLNGCIVTFRERHIRSSFHDDLVNEWRVKGGKRESGEGVCES